MSRLIRPLENAYPEPPFFRLGLRTAWNPSYLFGAVSISALGSIVVYGYGVLVHIIILQVAGFLLIPLLSFFKKNFVFHSLLWNTELMILALLLPLGVPWWLGFIAGPLFLLGARLLMVLDYRLLFQPHALVLVLLLRASFPASQATVFQVMEAFHFQSWLDASLLLFLGKNPPILREVSFLIGGAGGSVLLVLLMGALLSLVKILYFSTVLFYGIFSVGVLFGLFEGRLPPEFLSQGGSLAFIAVFLLQNPCPLAYGQKIIHSILAACIGAFLLWVGYPLAFLTGLLAANTCIPLLNSIGSFLLFPAPKEKRPPLKSALLTGTLSLALSVSAYLLSRIL